MTIIHQKDVFISWTGKDRKVKDEIKNYLQKQGIQCIDSDEDCFGNFVEWSASAATSCSVFLLILTENTLKSPHRDLPGVEQ